MGEGNKKLSKRDPESNLLAYRDRGFLPEGLLNYLALLGWAIAEDRDVFTLDEMVAAFDVAGSTRTLRASTWPSARPSTPAHAALPIRGAGPPSGALPVAGWSPTRRRAAADLLDAATPLVQERMTTLGEARTCSGSCSSTTRRCRTTRTASRPCAPRPTGVLAAATTTRSRRCRPGTPRRSRRRCARARRRHGHQAQATPSAPVRVAVTGRRVSPPLFESMELLGRERIVILLTTPLQAAGEEYGFRGYGLQALGAWVRNPWFAIVVTSLLFAAAHGTQNPALFLNRFAFGMIAGWLTVRTGGIEAAIGIHVVNNMVVLLIASAAGQLAPSLTPTEAPWGTALLDVAGMVLYAFLALRLAQRKGLDRLTVPSPPRIDQPPAPPWGPPVAPQPGWTLPLGYGVIGSPTDSGSV
jgi:hypothetical protein